MNNDDFLVRFREAPSPEFARALYKKISQKKENTAMFTKLNGMRFPLRRFGLAVAALCLVVGGLLITSPIVRAQVELFLNRFIEVGGVNFVVEDFDKSPGGEPVTDVYRPTLDKAVEMLPGQILIPTWVPENFALGGVEVDLPKEGTESEMAPFKASVVLTWKGKSDQELIFLEIIYPKEDDFTGGWLVNPGSQIEEVVIKGQPGALVREESWWNFEIGEWVESLGLRLFVKLGEGNVLYKFSSPESTTGSEDLIKMAESLQQYK